MTSEVTSRTGGIKPSRTRLIELSAIHPLTTLLDLRAYLSEKAQFSQYSGNLCVLILEHNYHMFDDGEIGCGGKMDVRNVRPNSDNQVIEWFIGIQLGTIERSFKDFDDFASYIGRFTRRWVDCDAGAGDRDWLLIWTGFREGYCSLEV
jgi:hypothetical protein